MRSLEELAATAEELAVQAEALASLVGFFSLPSNARFDQLPRVASITGKVPQLPPFRPAVAHA